LRADSAGVGDVGWVLTSGSSWKPTSWSTFHYSKGSVVEQTGLSFKQQRFIEEYLVDFNGTQAAIRAGYNAKNPGKIAYNLLRNPQIKSIVEQQVDALRFSKAIINEMCIGKLVEIINSDDAKAIDQIKAIHVLSEFTTKYSRRFEARKDGLRDFGNDPDMQPLVDAANMLLGSCQVKT
jgi:hypothetical protein